MVSTSYPPYPLWPTNPPRPSIYVSTFALTYPFVTPALAHFHAYKGFLPIWFAVSKEQFVDGAKVIARRAVERGVRIELVQFQAMPHCFAALLASSLTARDRLCRRRWADFYGAYVEKGW